MDTGSIGTVLAARVVELEGVDSLENLGHVHHDLARVVTVGQDIEQIVLGDEIETREGASLGVHEIEQSLLANGELLLDPLKIGEYPVLRAVLEGDLLLESVGQDSLDILINAHELLRLLGELLLYLSGVDEELLQERPVALDLTAKQNNLADHGKGLLPLDTSVLEGGQVTRGEHSIHVGLVLFKQLEVLVIEAEHLHIAALVGLEDELNANPDGFDGVQGLLHLGFLTSLIADFLDVFADLAKLEVVDLLESGGGVDGEVNADLLADHIPMTFAH